MRIKSLITERIKQPKQRVKTVGKRELISWFFLLPSLIGVFVFFVAPFMVIIAYSFMNNPVQKEFVGFSNFVNVWNNEAFRKAGLNTLNFSFTAVPLAVLLSLILAVVMES
ncbi:MAG: sugar ABC transporter permease, partial [Butyrivibrio sp.]|nr:sugar ABC transporter permease [Butyrivibrio sp.]